MPEQVRDTVLLRGTYEEICEAHEERKVRKGELKNIQANNDPSYPGTHMLVVSEPPGALRTAKDLMLDLMEVDPDDKAAILHLKMRATQWQRDPH